MLIIIYSISSDEYLHVLWLHDWLTVWRDIDGSHLLPQQHDWQHSQRSPLPLQPHLSPLICWLQLSHCYWLRCTPLKKMFYKNSTYKLYLIRRILHIINTDSNRTFLMYFYAFNSNKIQHILCIVCTQVSKSLLPRAILISRPKKSNKT